MTWNDNLTPHLLDFLFELEKDGLKTPFIIAGGFGLFLKRRYLVKRQERTLPGGLPDPRSTEDIDIFVRRTTLRDRQQTQSIKDALNRLQYEVIETAKYMQWRKTTPLQSSTGEVKIDFLIGNVDTYRESLHIEKGRNPRRARNHSVHGFHARITPEALLIDEKAREIPFSGKRSNENTYETTVCIPHPFTYLMMKLFAFRDRQGGPHERHHAFDAFSIIRLLTEQELNEAVELGKNYAAEPSVREANQIVQDNFTGKSPKGMIAVKSHRSFSEKFEARHYDEFVQILTEIFNNDVIDSSEPQS